MKESNKAGGSNSLEIDDNDDDDDDDDGDDPGVGLLDINTQKVELTKEGRNAMKDFIRKQPSNMAPGFQLKGYQLLGINWLALLWRKGLSGILADEMGLGKTAQVIAFLAHLHEKGERGRFLVIVPASTLSNWLREFEKFCPMLRVKSYYGSQAEREELRDQLEEDRSYNVLVTTYAMATGNNSERKFLNRQRFKGIVLDEGHMLKNCTSVRYKQLMSIKTDFRLLLTGTPLQNNLQELLSLLIFIMPKLFAEHEEVLRTMFKVRVDASSEKSTLLSKERIIRARHLLAPFVLRRKKIQVLKDLPRKEQEVVYCDLHPDQKVLYNRIMSSSALQEALKESSDTEMGSTEGTKKPKKSTATSKKVANEFANMLMQLRKAADHPMLFREKYKDETLKKMAKVITKEVEFCDSRIDFIEEDMSVMTDFELHRLCKQYKSVNKFALPGNQWMRAGKVQVLEKLLPKLIHKDKSRVLIFSQFTMVLDILESILTTMDFKYLRMDGQTKVDERQPMIDTFNDDESYKIFLLSTKAGGFGINLTGANVVIMYDLDYNPHNDKQAEDRAHRVGQTRDVKVLKLISKNTIEEQIYQLASLKLKLDQHVSEDYSGNSSTSDSSASTPSAGIMSLIKQNWRAALSAQAAADAETNGQGAESTSKPEGSHSRQISSVSSLSPPLSDDSS
ncbi:SNF2 family N-terminal domain-containing protein [Mortierella sp. GBAus27b]|nr:SNF2 family N-terminal domain-containing protein [Mortierella sp. GBAus27b]